jgi:hypothetical protein
MQYVQRKLQRSVTEIRKSRSGRASRSTTYPRGAPGALENAGTALSSFSGMTRRFMVAAQASSAKDFIRMRRVRRCCGAMLSYIAVAMIGGTASSEPAG